MRINMIKARKKLKLTQEDVAMQIGRGRNTYASYELGTITPSLEVGLKIKEVLSVKSDDIFLNIDVMENDNCAT